MGFHTCEHCEGNPKNNRFSHFSSGDVNLTFANGHKYVMPDMILHYVSDHNWQPPQEFIDDVMGSELSESGRAQTRGVKIVEIYEGTRTGYLSGEIKKGSVPDGFTERLLSLMETASNHGYRAQSKGIATR